MYMKLTFFFFFFNIKGAYFRPFIYKRVELFDSDWIISSRL